MRAVGALLLLLSACGSGTGNGNTTGSMGQAIGGACLANTDCTSSFCVTEAKFATYTGGYCSQQPCATCPNGSSCVSGAAVQGQACLKNCTTAADCRTGYSCCTDATSQQKVCAPSTGTALQC